MKSRKIERILNNNKYFLGCFSIFNLPKFLFFPCSLIINNEKKFPHWISILLLEDTCIYFDSFGTKTLPIHILYFLLHIYKDREIKIFFNLKRIQSYSSYNCADFCIKFIQFVNSKHTFKSFLTKFDYKKQKNNDIIVKSLCL